MSGAIATSLPVTRGLQGHRVPFPNFSRSSNNRGPSRVFLPVTDEIRCRHNPAISTGWNVVKSSSILEDTTAGRAPSASPTPNGLQFTGEPTTPCDSCNGRGWLVCDFCEGQKVNVQAKNNRIYRRCPSCRTAGVVICPRCKVFRCVSYPDEKDTGTEL